MGCSESSDSNKPTLLLEYQSGDNSQKAYLLKLCESFKSEKKIGFKLSDLTNKFTVKLSHNGKEFLIQDEFVDTEEKLKESLDKIYNFLK